MQGLLSIGRFSQACRLSVRTLRRYDADGLLVPTLVDQANGRRYYSPAQLGEAQVIRLLRDLDVPLEEVRGLLGERDPQAARRRLVAHRDRLAQELARRRGVLGELDQLLAEPQPVTPPPVSRRTLPEQLVVACRTVTPLAGLPAALGAALGRLGQLLHEQGVRRAGPTTAVYHGGQFDPEAIDVEVVVPVAGWVRSVPGTDVRVLPAVDAVTTVHFGPYDRIGEAYRMLASWAGEHGWALGGQPREIYLVGPDRAGPDGLRTEVAWPLGTDAHGTDAHSSE